MPLQRHRHPRLACRCNASRHPAFTRPNNRRACMIPVVTGFANSPDHGEGHARDFRVRWALEEVGRPYDMHLLPWKDFKTPEHRARHPFGKIPTYEEGGLTLFESGAIVLHVAERNPGLLPQNADARARAI